MYGWVLGGCAGLQDVSVVDEGFGVRTPSHTHTSALEVMNCSG